LSGSDEALKIWHYLEREAVPPAGFELVVLKIMDTSLTCQNNCLPTYFTT